jgi:hypothetical protein
MGIYKTKSFYADSNNLNILYVNDKIPPHPSPTKKLKVKNKKIDFCS